MAKKHDLAAVIRGAIESDEQGVYALAESSGVPHPTIYRFLRGSRGLGLDVASRLCASLGLELVRKKTPEKTSSTT
jgi:hypothetical protein